MSPAILGHILLSSLSGVSHSSISRAMLCVPAALNCLYIVPTGRQAMLSTSLLQKPAHMCTWKPLCSAPSPLVEHQRSQSTPQCWAGPFRLELGMYLGSGWGISKNKRLKYVRIHICILHFEGLSKGSYASGNQDCNKQLPACTACLPGTCHAPFAHSHLCAQERQVQCGHSILSKQVNLLVGTPSWRNSRETGLKLSHLMKRVVL